MLVEPSIGMPIKKSMGLRSRKFSRALRSARWATPVVTLSSPGFPIFCPGADSIFNSRPVLFLVSCKLQGALHDGNSRIRQGIQIGCGYTL